MPASSNFMYVDSDVPPGVALRDWRRARHPRKPARVRRARRALALALRAGWRS